MPQQQSTTPGQPQAAQAHQVEQHLVAAGVPQQALDQAKAHGLNVQSILQLVGQLLPLVIQIVQQVQQSQGGGAQPQARQPSTQHSPGVVSDPDIGAP